MKWLGLAADVKVRQKIQKNPKRNKIKEETKKIKIPTCEIILMRGGGDPDLEDVFGFPLFFFFWWYRNKTPDSRVWKNPGWHIHYVFGCFKSKLYDNIDTQVSSFLWVVFMKDALMCKATRLMALSLALNIKDQDTHMMSLYQPWQRSEVLPPSVEIYVALILSQSYHNYLTHKQHFHMIHTGRRRSPLRLLNNNVASYKSLIKEFNSWI